MFPITASAAVQFAPKRAHCLQLCRASKTIDCTKFCSSHDKQLLPLSSVLVLYSFQPFCKAAVLSLRGCTTTLPRTSRLSQLPISKFIFANATYEVIRQTKPLPAPISHTPANGQAEHCTHSSFLLDAIRPFFTLPIAFAYERHLAQPVDQMPSSTTQNPSCPPPLIELSLSLIVAFYILPLAENTFPVPISYKSSVLSTPDHSYNH